MIILRFSCATFSLLALAACGSSDGTGDETAGGTAGSGKGPAIAEVRLDPGQWETSHEIVSMEAPGMPKEAMAAMTGQKTVIKSCITPEQAAKPNADFFTAKDNGCSYQDFAMSGGRISGTLTCAAKEGPGSMTMTMDGQYARQSYQVEVEMKTDAGSGGMTIKAKGSGRRLGDCPAGEAG